MNKSTLYQAIAATITIAAVPMSASAAINELNLDSGVSSCIIAGTYPSCDYGLSDVISGSYFAFDTNGDETIQLGEKVPIQVTGPLSFNNITPATGSHSGTINGSESPAFNIWEFFGGTGMDYLTSPIIDNLDGSLNMTGWTVTWNGIPAIPMGGDATNFGTTGLPGELNSGLGTITCSTSCANGDTFTLDYAAQVPKGDASMFGGVGYFLHLEGTIANPPLVINVTGGEIQECNAANGNNVSALANVALDPSDSVATVSWTLDGQSAGGSLTFNQFVGLGAHQLDVEVNTINGATLTATRSLTIEDTTPPVVTAQFIERFTGAPISTLQLKYNHIIMQADGVSDVCDPMAAVTHVMYGTQSADDSFFAPYGFPGGSVAPQTQLDLRVEAKDASGNVTIETAVLNAP